LQEEEKNKITTQQQWGSEGRHHTRVLETRISLVLGHSRWPFAAAIPFPDVFAASLLGSSFLGLPFLSLSSVIFLAYSELRKKKNDWLSLSSPKPLFWRFTVFVLLHHQHRTEPQLQVEPQGAQRRKEGKEGNVAFSFRF